MFNSLLAESGQGSAGAGEGTRGAPGKSKTESACFSAVERAGVVGGMLGCAGRVGQKTSVGVHREAVGCVSPASASVDNSGARAGRRSRRSTRSHCVVFCSRLFCTLRQGVQCLRKQSKGTARAAGDERGSSRRQQRTHQSSRTLSPPINVKKPINIIQSFFDF